MPPVLAPATMAVAAAAGERDTTIDAAPSPVAIEAERLAGQVAHAVRLLDRFGALLTVALHAVGEGDADALTAALTAREALVVELGPLLAELSEARRRLAPVAGRGGATIDGPAGADARALDLLLRPLDEALGNARQLHERLTDEVGEPSVRRPGRHAVADVPPIAAERPLAIVR